MKDPFEFVFPKFAFFEKKEDKRMKKTSLIVNTILTGLVAVLLILLNLQILGIKEIFSEPSLAAGPALQSPAPEISAASYDAAPAIADISQSDQAKSLMENVKQQMANRTKLDDFLAPALWEGSSPDSEKGSVTITGSGDYIDAYRKYDGLLPLGTYIYLDIKASDASSIDWITLYLMEDLNYANYYEVDLLPGLKEGGQLVLNRKDVLTGAGTPKWSGISALRIAFGTKSGKKASVTLGEISTYSASPMCSIWFDDGWKTTYTDAFPVMREKGFKGVLSVVSSYVGCPDFCSEADLNDMYANGWDFTNHTDDHRNLSEISAEEAEEEITSCFDYLVSHGYTRAAGNVVPPYCEVTDETDKVISRLALTSRVCYSKYNILPITDPYHLGFREVFSDTSPETAMQWIDEAIENDLWLVLLFHSIESPSDESTKYSRENFKKIIDYLDQKRSEVSVVTLSEILDGEVIKTTGQAALKADTKPGQLIFEDEFKAPLDAAAWNIIEAEPFKNNELQTYTKSAVTVEDGMLKITSGKEGKGYTSGAVTTENKQLFRYGRIEIRAKLPSGKGMFPAFWLLPQSGELYPEIDIIEFLGDDPDSIWHVMHYEKGGEKRKYSRKYQGESFDSGFHIFSLEWTEKSLKWFIDGVETYSVKDNIPSGKMFLYINTAVGGDWPGSPGESTEFPQTMLIDYIKYYG